MNRGIGIGAAQRLDERADHVVVLVALTVVPQQRAIHGLRDIVGGDRRGLAVPCQCDRRRGLEACEGAAAVTGGEPDQRRTRVVRGRNGTGKTSRVADCTINEHADVVIGEWFQREEQGARQQR